MKLFKIYGLALLTTILLSTMALAQSSSNNQSKGFGIRTGYGTNPDQFLIGAQAVLGKTLGFMRFAPSIDAGFGDDMSTYLFNSDFHLFSFSPPGSPAKLYAGTGASLAVFNVKNGSNDTEIGLNVITGMTFPMGRKNEYNLEVRFGFADMPDLRVLFGVMFGSRSTSTSKTVKIIR